MKGVKYEGDAADFSVDSVDLEEINPNENIFDLYLSEGMFDETATRQIIADETSGFFDKIDAKNLMTFVTIDFYNHETVHSALVEGLQPNYLHQASFTVNCNHAFIKYLQCESIHIEIYASQGLEPIKLGYGNIALNCLVEKNQNDGVSGVVNQSVSLYDNKDSLLGILQYKMRMRFPIAEKLKWFQEKEEIGEKLNEMEQFEIVQAKQRRVIQIEIEKAQLNVSKRTRSFIFYQFSGKDFPTKVSEGKSPNWNYHQQHVVTYNRNFVSYIKNSELEFIVLDDQESILNQRLEQNESDYIGSAYISLIPLLKNETIKAIIEVKGSKGEKKGTISLKIYWLDKKLFQVPAGEPPDSLITKAFHNDFRIQIGNALNDRELTVQSAFKMFDSSNINFIALNAFMNMVINILNLPVTKEQVQSYYSTLPQPLDFVHFENIFGEFLQSEWDYRRTFQSQIPESQAKFTQNAQQLINRIDQGASEFADYKQQNIRDQIISLFLKKLENQNEIQIFNEVDSNQNQQVSFFELKSYLLKNGMKQFNDEDLWTFLEKFDQNKDNQINLREFFDYLGLEKERSLRYSRSYYQPKSAVQASNEAIERVQTALLNYMKQKRLTFYDMYVQIDVNRNKYISQREFRSFLMDRFYMQLTEQEFDLVWKFFDNTPDGKLSVKEFNDSLKKKAWGLDSKKMLLEQQARESLQLNQGLVSRILDQISRKMEREQKSFSVLFSEIDKNNDGTISQSELQEYLTKELELKLEYEDFNQLFRRFDANYDDCISITEFRKVFEEEKARIERMVSQNSQGLGGELIQSVQFDDNFVRSTQIPPRFFDYLRQNATKIYLHFQSQYQSSVWIPKQSFKKQLLEEFSIFQSAEAAKTPLIRQLELTEVQINSMIGYTQIENQYGEVNYDQFVQFFKERGREDQLFKNLKEDQQGQSARQKAADTFKRINKILKIKNISQQQFFNILDLNKDSKNALCINAFLDKLNFFELQKAFKEMHLNIAKYDAEQIFRIIDQNHKGEVRFDEFQKAFLELTSS